MAGKKNKKQKQENTKEIFRENKIHYRSVGSKVAFNIPKHFLTLKKNLTDF